MFALLCLALFLSGHFQESKQPVCTIEFVSNELSRLIKRDAKVEILAEGFEFTEGPVWLDKQKMLLFSDVPANTIVAGNPARVLRQIVPTLETR